MHWILKRLLTTQKHTKPSTSQNDFATKIDTKVGKTYERCMALNCTALFSLMCNMEICGTRATNTHTPKLSFRFGCDMQWQMNNVKWFIVLCIIINIVINFHDLHALQRVSIFDVVRRIPYLIPIAVTCLLHNYHEFIIVYHAATKLIEQQVDIDTHTYIRYPQKNTRMHQIIGNFLSSLSTYNDVLSSLIDRWIGCEALRIQCDCAEFEM